MAKDFKKYVDDKHNPFKTGTEADSSEFAGYNFGSVGEKKVSDFLKFLEEQAPALHDETLEYLKWLNEAYAATKKGNLKL